MSAVPDFPLGAAAHLPPCVLMSSCTDTTVPWWVVMVVVVQCVCICWRGTSCFCDSVVRHGCGLCVREGSEHNCVAVCLLAALGVCFSPPTH